MSTADLEPNGSEKSNTIAVAAATRPDKSPLQLLEAALGAPDCPGVTLLGWAAGAWGAMGLTKGCHGPEGLRVLQDLLLLLSAILQKLGHYRERLSRTLVHQAVSRPSGPPFCSHLSLSEGRILDSGPRRLRTRRLNFPIAEQHHSCHPGTEQLRTTSVAMLV